MRRTVIALLAVVALALTPLSPAQASNKAVAKQCQKNGWTSLYRSDGTTFASQDACVSYGAKGGQILTAPPTYIVLTAVTNYCGGECFGYVEASGLLPGAPVSVYGGISGGPSFLIGQGSVPQNGTLRYELGLSCGFKWSGIYIDSVTLSGQPIRSNTISSPCG